jgi:Immunoglobulin domain/Immunoglobulin I-set domain
LSYQWSFNGTNLLDATNRLLVIANVQLSDAGNYAVEVSNALGSEESSNALLAVVLLPAFVSQPTDQVVKLGDTATFEAIAVGTAPLNWQWSFNETNLPDATNSVLVTTNARLSDAGNYAVQVSNAFGSEKSSNALLSVSLPPAILVQPTNQIFMAGGIARFGVAVTGTPPLNYQWRRDGIDLVDDGRILGANCSDLIISNLVQSDSGLFSVTVSNRSGSVFSSNATLLVYVIDHFAWNPIPSPRFVNVPFPVRIRALDATNGLLTGFAGSVVLTSTAGVSVDPSVSGGFVLGEWTGSVTVSQAATGTVLVANDGSGHLGYANPINVIGLPSLSVERSGGSLLISWPAEASAFALETSADLSSWSPLVTPIDLSGGKYQIRVRISTTNSFYRLHFVGP